MNRRNFIFKTAMAASGAGLAFSGFTKLAEIRGAAQNLSNLTGKGFGELLPVSALNTGEIHLALPKNFQYKVIGQVGKLMADNRKTPRAHDGMAAFQIRNEWRIVRNHEINDKLPKNDIVIGMANHYDETAGGGTTTLVIDPKTHEIVRDFVSLSGTLNNCAGGATPWQSWISCEETTYGQTKYTTAEGLEVGGFAKPHGYCFEVRASANSNVTPVPLTAMGRFAHEAIAVDAKRGIVYQTEDNNPAGFYRFLPNRYKHLEEGGKLQVLVVRDKLNFDTRTGQRTGAQLKTTWLSIDDPNPPEADTNSSAVFNQGSKKGAALFARLEGCFTGKNGHVYFASTNGGDNQGGQIWLYEPDGKDKGILTLVFESPSREILDMPDNICLHPKNNLLFLCEDSDYSLSGTTPENFVRILSPDGRIVDFAKNISPGKETSEFAGATFSPDGKTLFVNIQTAGITVAIWGNWENLKNM